jgi:hypothetical protein
MKPRSAKAKGTRLEKAVMDLLNKLPGWRARKQPGSGIFQGFPHDVYAKRIDGEEVVIECKSWKHGWRTGDKAMGQADMLVIKPDHGDPMVYLSLARFAELTAIEDAARRVT